MKKEKLIYKISKIDYLVRSSRNQLNISKRIPNKNGFKIKKLEIITN